MTDRQGKPRAVLTSAANEHDITFILPLVYLMLPGVGGKRGRLRQYPKTVSADCGYTSRDVLSIFQHTHIDAIIPQQGQPQVKGWGSLRWPVERTIRWLKQFRRMGVRRERKPANYDASVTVAMSLICFRKLAAV